MLPTHGLATVYIQGCSYIVGLLYTQAEWVRQFLDVLLGLAYAIYEGGCDLTDLTNVLFDVAVDIHAALILVWE